LFGALKKKWGPEICSWLPLEFWHRLLDVELVLPYYHVVTDRELAHVSGLFKFRSVRQFKADLEFFLQFYTPVSLQDIICYLDGTGQLPKRCFLLTFDDGFREIYDIVAPILHAQGIPAVFFLTTSVVDNRELCYLQKISLIIRSLSSRRDLSVGRQVSRLLTDARVHGPDLPSRIRAITYRQRHVLDELGAILGCDFKAYVASTKPYLTSGQISDLIKKGFAIGAHGVDHAPYFELSLEQQLLQTRESLVWLSDRFQYECHAFAFPFTGAGVSLEFFQTAFADGRLKVSFGTHGLRRHFFSRHLNRLTMEAPHLDAAQLMGREFALTVFRKPLAVCENSSPKGNFYKF
jgi:peptidoglycan/xylan/chitin deacetylase (PgdA/CDA1 family)